MCIMDKAMVWWILPLTLVLLASSERNEAVKTARQMESATRTLVDNLIAELSELRRKNADITMKAELLAKEVTLLSKEKEEVEQASDLVQETDVHQHEVKEHAFSGAEDVNIKQHKAGMNCRTYNKLTVTDGWAVARELPPGKDGWAPPAECWFPLGRGGVQGSAFSPAPTTEHCKYVDMTVPDTLEFGNEPEAWKCSGLNPDAGEKQTYMWPEGPGPGLTKHPEIDHCYFPRAQAQYSGYFKDPCLKEYVEGNMVCIRRTEDAGDLCR